MDLACQIAEQFQAENTPNHPLIHDRRHKEHQLSLGHRMLQCAEILEEGPKAADQAKYEDFRTLYGRFGTYCQTRNAEMWSEDNSEQLGHLAQRLKSDVIQAAVVVCSTASNGGEFIMRCNTKRAKPVILDEAALTAEHLTLPILINDYRDLGGVLFVGDPTQLRPLSLARKENNIFRDRLDSTLMERLVVAGFKVEFFDTQHRMHPLILAIFNKIIYGNRLITADPLKVENLPADALSKNLEDFNQEKFRRNINVLYLDYG